jgi:hypothetical protein
LLKGNGSTVLAATAGTDYLTPSGAATLYAARANNLSDLASASTARTNLGLGTLATQNGTFSGTSSGTNTGDQDISGLIPRLSTITITGTTPAFPGPLVESTTLNNGRRQWFGPGNAELRATSTDNWNLSFDDGTNSYLAAKVSESDEPWKLSGWGGHTGPGSDPIFSIDPPVLLPVNGASGTAAIVTDTEGRVSPSDMIGLGTGVATALAVNVGSAGAFALTTSNVATATALQTSRTIFGQSFNGSANVDGNLLTTGHLASVPSGGEAGHLVTLNGTAPTVVAGRSAWWSNGSGVPSFRNGTGSAVTLLRSSDLGTNVATFLATPTSANLAAAVTDETGSGSLVFATSPTITTPTISRASTGLIYTAQDNNGSSSTFTSDANGRSFLAVNGKSGAVSFGGAYMQLNGFEEAWTTLNVLSNTSGQRVMRFGTLSNRFSIQRLNDAISSITATPFSFANNAPSDSFYMSASGGIGFGTTSDPGAGGIQTNGKIIAGNTVRLKGYTFATLPAGTQGDKAFITDGAASPTFRANAAGGGSTVTEVFFNGTNWINS